MSDKIDEDGQDSGIYSNEINPEASEVINTTWHWEGGRVASTQAYINKENRQMFCKNCNAGGYLEMFTRYSHSMHIIQTFAKVKEFYQVPDLYYKNSTYCTSCPKDQYRCA